MRIENHHTAIMSSWSSTLGHYVLSIVFSPVTLPAYMLVSAFARKRSYVSLSAIPHNEFGLLLAIAPLYNCPYYNNRIKAAAELYHAGKIEHIIASGGRYPYHNPPYDEVTAMRDSLLAHGVRSEDIILDYDGFRTFESVRNAKTKYGLNRVTIISQKYHVERAVILALRQGIDAIGYGAAMTGHAGADATCIARELPARVKMLADLLKPR